MEVLRVLFGNLFDEGAVVKEGVKAREMAYHSIANYFANPPWAIKSEIRQGQKRPCFSYAYL